MSKRPITKRGWIAHLRTLLPETIVGERAAEESCPIAREVERLHPDYEHIFAGTTYLRWINSNTLRHHDHANEDWQRDFISTVDTNTYVRDISARLIGRDAANHRVTAAEALYILTGKEATP